jgi:hypothetical protein
MYLLAGEPIVHNIIILYTYSVAMYIHYWHMNNKKIHFHLYNIKYKWTDT